MKKIQMVDLKSQYEKIKKEIDTAIQEVIDNTSFVKGPVVNEFEKELAGYLNAKHVIACANGTDALQIALMTLGLKPGDEVITSNFTFIATVEVIALLGLTPVLIDVDPETFLITPQEIERHITPKTKAIIPVHLFGQNCDMEAIMKLAQKHNLYVVEDAAQSIGSKYKFESGHTQKSGTMGNMGCTSFFPSKNLGCFGDGGAIITNDDELAKIARSIANHGMEKRYHHDRIGVNSRLDGIQAAVLRNKLKYLDNYCKQRQNAASYYDEAFSGLSQVQIPERVENSDHVFHQYTLKVKVEFRDELKNYLNERGIPCMIYYPIPLHKQNAFKDYVTNEMSFPVSDELVDTVLSLPMHTELDEEQLQYITSTIKDFFKN